MPEQNYNFGTKLFGWDKLEVNGYVNKAKVDNEKKLQQLKNQIDSLKKENEEITLEISDLKQEINFKMKSDDFMDFALRQYEKWMPLINKAAENQVSESIKAAEKQERIYNMKIEEFNNIIKNTQDELNSILKNVLQKNENLSENVKEFIENKNSCKKNEEIIMSKEVCIEEPQEVKSRRKKQIVDSQKNISINNKNLEGSRNDIRSKYLVGKLAGEDLLDRNNNIIISKNSVITLETIEKAEKEGKLSDLIINMVIP